MSEVLGWIVELMRTIGAPGVGVATALETVFPPVPSEVVLPLAGYTASEGHYGLVAAVVWATVGSLVGAFALYLGGAVWGVERMCRLADRLPLVHRGDVERAVEWFRSHGRAAVFLGRLVPGVRSLISIPAGMDRMPVLQFAAYTAAGSLLWNTLLIGAGYELGAQWHLVERYVGDAATVVYALLAALMVWFVVRRRRSHRRPATSAQDEDAGVSR